LIYFDNSKKGFVGIYVKVQLYVIPLA